MIYTARNSFADSSVAGGFVEIEKKEPQVSHFIRLAGYQEGAVVSRQLLNKKTGTVTLFAFDAGQSLSEHTAPFDAMAFVLEGKTEITISGKVYALVEGEMIIMPANQPHAVKAVERFKMMLIMIRS